MEGSIKTIANILFGRNWKEYYPNQSIDNNSLPCLSNLRRTERYAEALVLWAMVEEIVSNNTKSCVVYSSDGSGQSGEWCWQLRRPIINNKWCTENSANVAYCLILYGP